MRNRSKLRLLAWITLLALTAMVAACRREAQPQTPGPGAATSEAATSATELAGSPTTSPSFASPTSAVAAAASGTATGAAPDTPKPPATETPPVTHTVEVDLPLQATETPTSTLAATRPVSETTPTTDTAATTPTSEIGQTATAGPPPVTTLEQPPYAPSACSDKYPCNEDVAAWEERVRVPPGYVDRYIGRVDGNPTSFTFGPDGRLYIALLQGTIVTMDSAGQVSSYAAGLNTPTGIAFRPGSTRLYVSSRVRNDNYGGEAQISIIRGGAPIQIVGGLPCCYAGMHGPNGIAFGADGFGYIGVGGRADHGEIPDGSNRQDNLQPLEASILRFSPDGSLVEPYARGFRNPYDIAWDATGQLYATDNAPDYGPPEELHRVVPGGQHGYPWFDCEVCFGRPADVQLVPPVYNFVPHASPTGITAYMADQFPGSYNHLFVTLWSAFPGAQKVVRLSPGGTNATDFALGFAQPIDVTVGPDGSLYVADYATGVIFQISYSG
jgi:glucose/arabinose dehydrogenase